MIQNIKIYLSKNNKYKNIVSIIFQKKKSGHNSCANWEVQN